MPLQAVKVLELMQQQGQVGKKESMRALAHQVLQSLSMRI